MANVFRVEVAASNSRAAALVLARAFQVPLEAARQLLAESRVLPRDLEESEARRLVESLRQHGVSCQPVAAAGHGGAVCGTHSALAAELPCEDCRELVCVLCRGREGQALCARCSEQRARRTRAKWLRVSVLLMVLVLIAFWGTSRQRTRERRLEWERPLSVAVVLLARGEVKPEVRQAWSEGVGRLEGWLEREAGRYRADLGRPVRFVLAGPQPAAGLELTPPGDSLVARALHAWTLSRALSAVDEAAGLSSQGLDARIYVMLEPTSEGERLVEGMAEAGGSVGLVRGVQEDTELTLELTAVAHELFHCLGAEDAYDAQGHARVPEGLVEPGRQPLYPQPAAEVMVGEVPVGEAEGRLPESLEEVRVGPFTAISLRWAP
ncbi:B-box zinc finger protein [Vitiosangium sp. GDMCC 1.1324]|uniref:B-box zinc finger protein n=1 Tax=Vitiosangium sp. (strain GDMCC 1.1324) TaxID=2138576 RepID=UPI0011B68BE7|nr:B-box zinc finger protein [Vitiosangium sp. GDMCC 1.1324]